MKTTTALRLALVATLASAFPAAAQAPATAPFVRTGEELVYSVRSSRFGNIGTATMRAVADTVDGRPAYRLSFDFAGKVMLFKVRDRTQSWLDAGRMTTVHYTKNENTPVGSRKEDARIAHAAGTWTDKGGTHKLASQQPLDELAFIYLVRALAPMLENGATMTVPRHFDEKRNPVTMEGRGRLKVAALGETRTATVVRMDARDSRNPDGRTRITFYIGDDPAHLPLRMDTSMPMAGALTMTLKSVSMHGGLVAGSAVGSAPTRSGEKDAKESSAAGHQD